MRLVPQLNSLLCEIAEAVTNHKKKLILCAALFAAGIIVGCVIYGGVMGSWWYYNRYDYVIIVIDRGGFFTVFFRFLLNAVLLAALITVLCFGNFLRFLKYALIFFCGMYLGMYIRIALSVFALRGVFYIVFLFLIEQALNVFGLFLSMCEEISCPSFSDTLSASRCSYAVLTAGIVLKTLIVFVLLRLLTALI